MDILKKQNIINIFWGYFFLSISFALVSYFLPFYLKESGLSILEIGFLFTIGLAIGSLILSIIYSSVIRRIKLRTGLMLSGILSCIHTLLFFIFPTSAGVFASKLVHEIQKPTMHISTDVALQHNSSKDLHRKINSYHLVVDNLGIITGIILSLFFVSFIGFRFSLFIFSLLTIPCLYFYYKVSDNTRFKLNKEVKLPEISKQLKLVLFSELIYWLALSSSFTLVITFLVTDYLGGSIWWIGILFIALYGSMTITTFITRKFLDKFDLIITSIIGMIILLFSALFIIISTNIYWVFAAMILEGIGGGIWVPSKSAIYWKLVNKSSREKVSGYFNGLRGFVNAMGPLFGGFLVTYTGILAPFYFKAGIAGISVLVYWWVLKSD